jgi:hypothetical protein
VGTSQKSLVLTSSGPICPEMERFGDGGGGITNITDTERFGAWMG